MKILMVLTSHDKLGHTGRKTGFWLEEFGEQLVVEGGQERVVEAHLDGRAEGAHQERLADAAGHVPSCSYDPASAVTQLFLFL
jgi:hypothetical protein